MAAMLSRPQCVNKGVHLILVLNYRDHNMKYVLHLISFTFSGNKRLCIDSNFTELPRKDYEPILVLVLLMATCHYPDQA